MPSDSDPMTEPARVQLAKPERAVLRVRVIPWRVRARRLRPKAIRDHSFDGLDVADDLGSFIVIVVLGFVCLLAAPVVALVLAILLLPFEIGVVVFIAVALIAMRLAGVVPWTVVLVDSSGGETTEKYRNIVRALRQVRAVNGSYRAAVQLVGR